MPLINGNACKCKYVYSYSHRYCQTDNKRYTRAALHAIIVWSLTNDKKICEELTFAMLFCIFAMRWYVRQKYKNQIINVIPSGQTSTDSQASSRKMLKSFLTGFILSWMNIWWMITCTINLLLLHNCTNKTAKYSVDD